MAHRSLSGCRPQPVAKQCRTYAQAETALSQCRRRRSNRSRYDIFWQTINWLLPDTILAQVWGTDRGNLRARRARLGIAASTWRADRDRGNPVYEAVVQLERLKARRFDGPRPCRGACPHRSEVLP